MDVVCLGILVADVIARPLEELPERGSLGLVDEIALRGGGCALNTGTALARLVHLPGANGRLRVDELDAELLLSGRALRVAGGLVTSLDTVWDASGRFERVLPALPHTDPFRPSVAEARAIAGEGEPERVAEQLRDLGAGDVVLKLGTQGGFVAGHGRIAAVPGGAVDGTGAGDAFAAGLLYGRLAGWPLERSARLANAIGAPATTAVGAAEGLRGLEESLGAAGLD